MTTKTPTKELAGFIARFSPQVASVALEALKKMRARLPGAVELVYDNYNALAIAFAPSERTSDALFSIALYPRWVSLFFLSGWKLKDPKKVLRGNGVQVRYVVLEAASDLDMPAVRALMRDAARSADPQIDSKNANRIVIKSISKKQRPRRPAGQSAASGPTPRARTAKQADRRPR